ncbi:hypothetical protein SAMN05216294_2596 [Flagellimonas zhangzhouensis]|uniref:Uncharacterized protein n=1 Tax=Flagellimonas zhangzhouensis TaxID=1073328 RepID=A0A1H2SSF3_9FLAO|nr:hypothetical protein SAMN05216294_2596 [Allomuricauda zhangzhouensis]SDW34457.1 hypothetical protein SAMN04487892_1237 [Allomuricauda zhangzhouensis]
MENIYSEEQKSVKTVRASKRTIDFLLSYSKSIHVVDYKKHQFEVTLN